MQIWIGVRAYFKELKQMNIDAVIISDPAVFMIAKEELPETDIHISTRQIIRIMAHSVSGTDWVRSVW